ncbi:CAP-Gly domain-containing linker protein 1 [Rhizoctonia solani]|uniref:CAP-Gly domain-containing linker protein 1 n=1 Tax=Rhizoctonia solani TaxID=456999 RepID=A0A0K6G5A2_9AGAM|nr:CAP-Gly domain-containing linker protein 1 [Rhizoctonia solani]
MNAANLFDRNPLHVAHLQGPVDRLHDTNLRAIYERAGKILLIQRWKDLNTAVPHAFLLFESETAANSCCNRIGSPRITTPNNSHPQSITASILQPNQPNHPALQQWLSSQNMAPSYVIKNPPPPPKAAAFPLVCLRVLNEDASDVVGKLREFKCGPGWWRFVAQMYVANKLWAAARMVLKCEKEPEDEVIDISDDSTHEHPSDDDQTGQRSSKPSTAKGAHNAWLPSKRDVTGARAKLGVVTSKPGAAVKPGVATKAAKSASGPEAPPFVPTPMSESPLADATPQANPDTPPTVPATLPKSTVTDVTPSKPSSSSASTSATTNGSGAKSTGESTQSSSSFQASSPQPPAKPSTSTKPASSSTPSSPPKTVTPQPNPTPPQPSSRPTNQAHTPPASTLDKPIPSILSKSPNTASSTEATDAGSPSKVAPLKSTTPVAPSSTATKSTTLPTAPKASAGFKSVGPRSTASRVSTPPMTTRSVTAALSGHKATPKGPRALVNALGVGPSNSLSTGAATAILAPDAPTTSIPGTDETSTSTPQPVNRSTPQPAQTNTEPTTSQVKQELEQETLGNRPLVSRGSSIVSISRGASAAPPTQGSSSGSATQNTPPAPVTQEPSTTQDPPSATQVPPPTEESSVVPMEEDSFSAPTEGDSSFGVPIEDLFSVSIAPTEDASPVIPPRDLPPFTATQNPPTAPTQESTSAPPARDASTPALPNVPTSSHRIPTRTPMRSPSREPLSFFGISSSPSSLLVALPPTSSSPTKRKSDTFETRLIKRRRHRTSSSKSEPIIVEPEISALEAEKARAAELQAEEDRVRELLGVDMSDYAESVMARLSGSDKASSRGIVSSSDKSKSSPVQETPSVESDLDLELRSLRTTRDENEALKMKIKVLELTLPTAESVKNELYAERKEKSQLIEALEIERSLLTQSEALRKQSDTTREGLYQRTKQLEERLSESTGALEKAREAAQVAAEQRRKAEEAASAVEAERTKLEALLDAERDLVSRERAALADESSLKVEAQVKLAATEARLASEQRRYAEAMDQASKERTEAKNFLDAEKAIVSAQEAKLEREKEIRGELETKLREVEDKLKEEQIKRAEDKKNADNFLQSELTMAMKLVTAEREITKNERAKTVVETEARGLAEKELILLKEKLEASEKALQEALNTHKTMKRDLTTFKDQLNESERRESMLRAQLSTAGSKLAMTEGRARAAEDRATEAELARTFESTKLQAELVSEKKVLMMERQALAKERMARKDLEGKLATVEEQLATGMKQTNELQAQLKSSVSSNQGTREQLQTQRTLLHIARTRIQELEQAIQRVEADLDAARTAEATAKTMVQLWGPPRAQLSSPISDIVEQQADRTDADIDPFIPLMKPPRQQSFKLKRTAAPARLLKVDMPSGEPADIDLGGLPANPEAIIDLLYRSKCAGVFWDIIMDEYGAMGCFDAAEAIAEGKLKYQP